MPQPIQGHGETNSISTQVIGQEVPSTSHRASDLWCSKQLRFRGVLKCAVFRKINEMPLKQVQIAIDQT